MNDVFVVLLIIQQFIFHPVINYLLYILLARNFLLVAIEVITTTTIYKPKSKLFFSQRKLAIMFMNIWHPLLDHWAVEAHRTPRSQQMGASCTRYYKQCEQVNPTLSFSFCEAWPKWVSWRFARFNSCLILLEHRWWCMFSTIQTENWYYLHVMVTFFMWRRTWSLHHYCIPPMEINSANMGWICIFSLCCHNFVLFTLFGVLGPFIREAHCCFADPAILVHYQHNYFQKGLKCKYL